jgi:hypothetical protein
VVLKPLSYSENVRVELPAAFMVDDLPDPTKLNGPFGSYETSYSVKDGELRFTRSLVLLGATIPVAEYSQVRSFFEKIRAAEQSPVVLARK